MNLAASVLEISYGKQTQINVRENPIHPRDCRRRVK